MPSEFDYMKYGPVLIAFDIGTDDFLGRKSSLLEKIWIGVKMMDAHVWVPWQITIKLNLNAIHSLL